MSRMKIVHYIDVGFPDLQARVSADLESEILVQVAAAASPSARIFVRNQLLKKRLWLCPPTQMDGPRYPLPFFPQNA
jgi:hypothetical protein